MEHSEIIKNICINIESDKSAAIYLIKNKYPFEYVKYDKRTRSNYELLKIYIRDGFIDRYFGSKMIFTPVLRIISDQFPDLFPFQTNWKMDECHLAYWELAPTHDHVVPIALGGKDEESNIVCTSMLHNSIKSNFRIEELGWKLLPCGNFEEWDGMIHWFIEYVENHPESKTKNYVRTWYNPAKKALKEIEG